MHVHLGICVLNGGTISAWSCMVCGTRRELLFLRERYQEADADNGDIRGGTEAYDEHAWYASPRNLRSVTLQQELDDLVTKEAGGCEAKEKGRSGDGRRIGEK